MVGKALHDRQGSHAGRGFRYQDAIAAWLCVRVWAGLDSPAIIIPEGNDDVEQRSEDGSGLVQVKSRRQDLGAVPISDVKNYIGALWERHDNVTPTPKSLKLVLERPIVNHETLPDGQILMSERLSNALNVGKEAFTLLKKTSIGQTPEPYELSIAIIVERSGCSPLAAQICYAEILRQMGKLAEDNGRRLPANYRGMSASDADRCITSFLAAIDVEQIEIAIRNGACEPADFLTPLEDQNFYLGVDVQPGHVAAGLVLPRMEPRKDLIRGLETRGAALVAGPSGAGKSAIMWDTAHALRHTVRWYRLVRVDPRDLPAIKQLLKTLNANLGSPVGIVVDDIGRRGADGWDILTQEFAAIPGALLLGSIREEDLFLIKGRSRVVEVRAEPDPNLAQRIFDELKCAGKTEWAGWQEPWMRSQGLVLEYAHILSAGERFEDTLREQVAERLSNPERGPELAILRVLSLAGAAGASAESNRFSPTLNISEEVVARSLARLIDEHLVRKGDGGRLTGLHQLRSTKLVQLSHEVPPPTVDVTFTRTVEVVSGSDLEPLISEALRNQSVNFQDVVPALVERLTREPNIDALSAILRGLGDVHIAVSAKRWLTMPNTRALVPTQVGTAVMLSFLSEPMPATNDNIILATAAGAELAAIRSNTTIDLRWSFLEAIPADLIRSIVGGTENAGTLNRFFAAQIGMPMHASVQAALASKRVDVTIAPLDDVVDLLGTLAEIDRPLSIAWVDEVGEEVLISRIPREVPWASPVSFENTPDGRVVHCDYHHIGIPGEDDTHGDVVRLCEIAMALSPRSDISASVARAPNGQPAGFAGHTLAEKRIPRANLPSAALPAWNRKWRDAIAILIATPTYTEYLSRADKQLNHLILPLERALNLVLQNKNVKENQLSRLNDVFEASQKLTPPAIAASVAVGTGSNEFNPHTSKLQNLLHSASTDLVRRFHSLPEGAAAYIAWTINLIENIDEVIRDEPWALIGGVPPSLEKLRVILTSVRLIAESVAGSSTRPSKKFERSMKRARATNGLRVVSVQVSGAAKAARAAQAVEVKNTLSAEQFTAEVYVLDQEKAIRPWPPSQVVVVVSIGSIQEISFFYQAVERSRELVPVLRRLIAIPIIEGKALPEMGLAGYETMLPLQEEARKWSDKLGLQSSSSHAWSNFDKTIAIASALRSMDRLSLGIKGRPMSEVDKRGQLEGELEVGIMDVEAIVTHLGQELADEALATIDMIRSGEIGYADAVHTTGDTDPVLEHLFGLRLLIEQAELDAMQDA